MDTLAYPPCDVGYHIDCLRADGEALADAARLAGLDAPVPACPGWRVRDLLKHIGYVHRWAATYVAERHEKWVDRSSEAEILRNGPADEALLDWFGEGHASLVRTLETADPGLTCWTFLDAPSPLAFWARRQAHETAIHRVDAQQAAARVAAAGDPMAGGDPEGDDRVRRGKALFTPRFAADGVDEIIMGFAAREARRGSWQGTDGSIVFRADDGAEGQAVWRLAARGGAFCLSRGDGRADMSVTAPAGDLYLLLWNRRPADGLAVAGNRELLAVFLDQFAVTWR